MRRGEEFWFTVFAIVFMGMIVACATLAIILVFENKIG